MVACFYGYSENPSHVLTYYRDEFDRMHAYQLVWELCWSSTVWIRKYSTEEQIMAGAITAYLLRGRRVASTCLIDRQLGLQQPSHNLVTQVLRCIMWTDGDVPSILTGLYPMHRLSPSGTQLYVAWWWAPIYGMIYVLHELIYHTPRTR